MEYFDSRGGRPATSAQRYSARIGNDGFEGQWQLARSPGDWQDDLKVTDRRSD